MIWVINERKPEFLLSMLGFLSSRWISKGFTRKTYVDSVCRLNVVEVNKSHDQLLLCFVALAWCWNTVLRDFHSFPHCSSRKVWSCSWVSACGCKSSYAPAGMEEAVFSCYMQKIVWGFLVFNLYWGTNGNLLWPAGGVCVCVWPVSNVSTMDLSLDCGITKSSIPQVSVNEGYFS